jgi:hypothetical protein
MLSRRTDRRKEAGSMARKKPSRWGQPGYEWVHEESGWFIGVRQFTFTDAQGGSVWQWKTARARWAFTDPQSSYIGWSSRSHLSTGNRTVECGTREEALASARAHVAALAPRPTSTQEEHAEPKQEEPGLHL